MAGTRYPLGAPPEPSGPGPDVVAPPLDDLLTQQESGVRRRRSPFEPPSGTGIAPRIVPRNLFRAAQADDVRTQAQTIAVKHDAADLGFNATALAERERLSHFSSLGDLVRPEQQVVDDTQPAVRFLHQRMLSAVADIRRSYDPDGRLWTPPPQGTVPDDLDPSPTLRHYGFVTYNETMKYGGLPLNAPGKMPMPATSLDEMRLAQEEYEAIRNGTYTPPPETSKLPAYSASQSVANITRAAMTVGGTMFDGKGFVGALFAATTAPFLSDGTDMSDRIDESYASFERWFAEQPTPVRMLIEELNPGNIGMALVGGPLAKALGAVAEGAPLATRVPLKAVQFIADTGFKNPLKAIGYTVGGSAAYRTAYEETEGQPGLVRFGAGLLASGGLVAVGEGAQAAAVTLLRGVPVGSTREVAPVMRTVLGEGGALKAGEPDEMLPPIAADVMATWREGGDVLAATLFPGMTPPRMAKPHAIVPVPPVLPKVRPAQARGVASQASQAGGQQVAALTSATARAADLAAQRSTTVPSGIMDNILRAEAQMADIGDSRIINRLNQASSDPVIRQAIMAAQNVRSELSTRLIASRGQFLGRVQQLYGSTDNLPERIQDVAGNVAAPGRKGFVGKVIDHIVNPQHYSEGNSKYLAPFLEYNDRNKIVNEVLEKEFGVAVSEFDTGVENAATGGTGLFFPNYNAGQGKAARGSGVPSVSLGSTFQERVYQTPMDRAINSSEGDLYEPVTDIAEMMLRLDEEKVNRAAREAFVWSLGGSRTPVNGWQEVPALEQITGAKMWLPPEQAQAAAKFLTEGENGLANFIEGLKNVRLNADFSPFTNQGSIGWFADPIGNTMNLLQAVYHEARANGPMGGVFRIFSDDYMHERIASEPEGALRFFTAMGATPQGGTPAEWRTGFLEMLNPNLRQLPVVGDRMPNIGLPIGRGIGRLNDGMTNGLMHAMWNQFDNEVDTFIAHGLPQRVAEAEAANKVKLTWLQSKARELGIARARGSVERAAMTSVTFARNTVDAHAHAATGMLKIMRDPRIAMPGAQLDRQTAREVEAAKLMSKIYGTASGLAATSAALTAEERGYSPADALYNATLDVNHPDWMVMWLGKDVKIPLMPVHRAFFRAMAPGDVRLSDDTTIPYVPGAGLVDFAKRRVTTSVSLYNQLVSNEDFYGNPIATSEGLRGTAQSLAYAVGASVPLILGGPVESYRVGDTPMTALQKAAWQVTGQTYIPANEQQVYEREQRVGARKLYDLPMEEKVALGLSPEQASAIRGASTLKELRDAIGTRSARFAASLANPAVNGAERDYAASLAKRAERGDKEAQALLGSVQLQEQLKVLAEADSVNGVIDGVQYRQDRSALIDQMVGKSEAFREVFEKFRQSDSPVDRLSTQWYELFDQATTFAQVGNKRVPVKVDYQLLNDLEDRFFAGMDPQMASLVQQNVATGPLGSGPAEDDLRQTRQQLATSGYWKLQDEVWTENVRNVAIATAPEDLKERISQTRTFGEWRKIMIERDLAAEMQRYPTKDPSAALIAVTGLFDSLHAEGRIHEELVTMRKLEWAREHAQDGLALKAQKWGYLSDSLVNMAITGVLGPAGSEPAAAPSAPPPGVAPRPRAERVAPQDGANSMNIRLVAEHQGGASYGMLAQRYGLTRDAVIGRIKRTLSSVNQPDDGLVASFERDQDGRITGIARAPLAIVRDADGRPVGLGRSV